MKDKKIVIASVLGVAALAYGVIKQINTGKKIKNLSRQVEEVANCHNGLCLHSQEKIEDLQEQINENREEIISGYEHLESLSNLLSQ